MAWQNKQTTVWYYGGDMPCGRLFATLGYAHKAKPHLSPHAVGFRTISTTFLVSPMLHGLDPSRLSKGIKWQESSNTKSSGEVAM